MGRSVEQLKVWKHQILTPQTPISVSEIQNKIKVISVIVQCALVAAEDGGGLYS